MGLEFIEGSEENGLDLSKEEKDSNERLKKLVLETVPIGFLAKSIADTGGGVTSALFSNLCFNSCQHFDQFSVSKLTTEKRCGPTLLYKMSNQLFQILHFGDVFRYLFN